MNAVGLKVSADRRASPARRHAIAAIGWLLAFNLAAPATAQVIDGFAPLLNGTVSKIVLQGDGEIVFGGTFSSVDGSPRSDLARVATDGMLDADFAPALEELGFGVTDLAVQSDGRMVVATGLAITRLAADGTADGTFHTSEFVNAASVALQPDGKILVGELAGAGRVMRLNPDGSTDASFHASHMGDGWSAQIVPLADGKILVAGGFDSFGDSSRARLVRLQADGSIDDSFDAAPDGVVYAVTPLPDGDILVAGCFGHIGGVDRAGLARLDRQGDARSNFNHGVAGGTHGCAMALATDNWGVIVAGDFDRVDSTPRLNMARILWSDTLDPSYDPDVVGIVLSLATQADNKVVMGGFVNFVGDHPRSYLARVNPDGSVDDLFGAGTDGPVQALAAWSDNSLVIGGAYTRIESAQGAQTAAPGLAWFKADGDDPVPNFAPQEICALPFCGVNGVALQPADRKIVIGHSFFMIGQPDAADGNPNDALPVMRLFPNGLLDPSFDMDAQAWLSGNVYAVLRQPDDRILVAGCLTVGAEDNVLVARLMPDGTSDDSFIPLQNNAGNCSVSGNSQALALALLPDGRIVLGGDFTYFGPPFAADPNLAVLRANGIVDVPVYADGPVLALATQADGRVLIGGAFSVVNDVSPPFIARMNSDTTMDAGFTPVVNDVVRAIGARADGKVFLGGDFTTVDGVARNHLALLGTAGEVQQNFHHDVNGTVQAIAVQSDGKVAFGGLFTTVDGLTHAHVARASVPDIARYAIEYAPRPPLAPWVYWVAQGAGAASGARPELSYSFDGVEYTDVGTMTFDTAAARWTFGDFAPPHDRLVFLRVRQTTGGGVLETILPIFDADEIFGNGFD